MFASCLKENKIVLINPENSLLYNTKATLVESGDISFALDSVTPFWHYSINYSKIGSDEQFSMINTPDNSIIIYNLSKPGFPKKIILDYDGPNGVGHLEAGSHLLLSADSILVYNPNYGVLYHVNSSGKIINKYTIINLKGTGLSKAIPEPSSLSPIIKNGHYILFPCTIHKRLNSYENYASILQLDLKTGQIAYLAPLPPIYSNAYWGEPFKYVPSITVSPVPNELVISYPVDPNLYKTVINGESSKSVSMGSKYFHQIIPMKNDVSFGTTNFINDYSQEQVIYSLSSADFASIKFDLYRNIYYRIAYLRPSADSVKMGYRTPDFSLIISDKDMSKIAEVKFSGEKYDPSMHFIAHDGYYIARKDRYAKEEDKLVFTRFKFQTY